MKPNINHPVIDKREDGTYIYFHDLPPVLPEQQDDMTYSQEDADFLLSGLRALLCHPDEDCLDDPFNDEDE